jgi:FMN phosphatase YigB (HAD superfamily)
MNMSVPDTGLELPYDRLGFEAARGTHPWARNQGRKVLPPPRSAFEKHVMDADCDLVSFDIFDTVLTRNVGEPFALFHEVGREAEKDRLIDCSALVFKEVRHASEQRARVNRHGREIRLDEIYEEIARVLDCEQHVEALMALELDAEARALCLIPEAALAVKCARRRFGSVIFISDMYLPVDFIERRLREHGLFLPGDRIYLSSKVGVQKGDGRLFRHVLEMEKLSPARLLHFGDSVNYDIDAARNLGIQAVHREAALNNPAEIALARHSSWNGGYGARLAGAARLARLRCPESPADKQTVWNVGATVTGPLVLLYARWILDRAARMQIKQLYFLARDGYFPYLAVKALLAKDPACQITAKYIHGSRQTYMPLDVIALGEKEWHQITAHAGGNCRTINDLAAALMMREETIRKHIYPLGFGDVDVNRTLSVREIAKIRRHALRTGPFNDALLNDIKAFQDLTKRYLEEHGFDPGQRTAIIDTGWTTRSHAPLYGFLKNLGCSNLKLFYIGLMTSETRVPLESVEAFIFNCARCNGAIRRDIYYARACEALLFAPDGRTTGFREEGGAVVPVLSAVENSRFIKKFFSHYAGGIRAFLEEAPLGENPCSSRHGLAELAEQIVARFWCEPTVDEARLWSGVKWQWDPQGTVLYPFARAYRLANVWTAFRRHAYPEYYPQFWVAGSLAVSPREVKYMLSLAIRVSSKIRGLLKRVKRARFWYRSFHPARQRVTGYRSVGL